MKTLLEVMAQDTLCIYDEDLLENSSVLTSNMSDSGQYPNVTCDNNLTSLSAIPDIPLYVTVTSTLFYVIIFLTGTFGNSSVVAVVGLYHDMRSSTNLFLVNLAIADLMVIVVAMPTALAELYSKDHWYFGSVMCTMVPLLEHSAAHASVLTMLIIAAERFQAICHPLKLRESKLCSKTMKLVTILLIWFKALLCSMPFIGICVYQDSNYYDGTTIKVCRQQIILQWQKAYIVCLSFVFFAFPFVILAILYIAIAKALVREIRYSHKTAEQGSHNKNETSRKAVVMLVVAALLFFFFHLPFRTISLWIIFAHSETIDGLGFEGYWNLLCFARLMFYLNSCTNPIVYNVISTKFRHAFVRVFKEKRNVVQRQNHSGITYDVKTNTALMFTRTTLYGLSFTKRF